MNISRNTPSASADSARASEAPNQRPAPSVDMKAAGARPKSFEDSFEGVSENEGHSFAGKTNPVDKHPPTASARYELVDAVVNNGLNKLEEPGDKGKITLGIKASALAGAGTGLELDVEKTGSDQYKVNVSAEGAAFLNQQAGLKSPMARLDGSLKNSVRAKGTVEYTLSRAEIMKLSRGIQDGVTDAPGRTSHKARKAVGRHIGGEGQKFLEQYNLVPKDEHPETPAYQDAAKILSNPVAINAELSAEAAKEVGFSVGPEIEGLGINGAAAGVELKSTGTIKTRIDFNNDTITFEEEHSLSGEAQANIGPSVSLGGESQASGKMARHYKKGLVKTMRRSVTYGYSDGKASKDPVEQSLEFEVLRSRLNGHEGHNQTTNIKISSSQGQALGPTAQAILNGDLPEGDPSDLRIQVTRQYHDTQEYEAELGLQAGGVGVKASGAVGLEKNKREISRSYTYEQWLAAGRPGLD